MNERDPDDERDYLAEAHAMLKDRTHMLLPELNHLRALDEHYQSELVRLIHEIERVTTACLKRN